MLHEIGEVLDDLVKIFFEKVGMGIAIILLIGAFFGMMGTCAYPLYLGLQWGGWFVGVLISIFWVIPAAVMGGWIIKELFDYFSEVE